MRRLLYSEEKVRGILIGTLYGDAAGARFEGLDPDQIPPLDFQYLVEQPARMYTDDTQMSISVFEEMVEHGTIDQLSLRDKFLKRFSPWRGYSGGMLEVMEQWRDGISIDVAARSLYHGTGSFGDGAAMRVAPISAFFRLEQLDELIEQVTLCSSLTHTHPYGIAGAVLQAYAVLLALNEIPHKEWMSRLFELPIESAFKIKLNTVATCLDQQASPNDSARIIGNGSDAMQAVSAALYSALRNKLSFTDTMLFAFSMGGDTDTIGAMAGAITGAWNGSSAVPPEWITALENEYEGKDYIERLISDACKSL